MMGLQIFDVKIGWIELKITANMNREMEDNSVKQIVLGALFLTFLAILVGVVLMGSPFLPGVIGEWVGLMVGLMTTPVFLEISTFLIGLMVVLAFNHWRQKREGDEFVDIGQVQDEPAGVASNVQDQASAHVELSDEMNAEGGDTIG